VNYDIIGDIHGHADALNALLSDMGYQAKQGAWRHADRQAIFVGDFIDRGPIQVGTVATVRRMVDAGSALAIMGNHEFNAIAWYLKCPGTARRHLRTHTGSVGGKNLRQHETFLKDAQGIAGQHKELVEWFLTLPLWLDLGCIRVVHACWHRQFMAYLQPRLAPGHRLTEALMVEACREPKHERLKDTAEPTVFKAVEALTKGLEIPLPPPHSFLDKDGYRRHRVRARWWDREAMTFRLMAFIDKANPIELPDALVPNHVRLGIEEGIPHFVGHYWLRGIPEPLHGNLACVDYSVAKRGKLVAYRWDGDPVLSMSGFHWVGK